MGRARGNFYLRYLGGVHALVAVAHHRAGHPGLYDVLVGLHVVCAVVGFGSVAVSGAYGAIGRRARAGDGVEEVRRFFGSGSGMQHLLLVAPVFGIAAMAVRPGGSEFGQVWAVSGLVLWALAAAVLFGAVRPAERAIRAGLAPDGGPTAVGAASGRLMWAAAASDVLFVVALMLMVTQPA